MIFFYEITSFKTIQNHHILIMSHFRNMIFNKYISCFRIAIIDIAVHNRDMNKTLLF